MFLDCLVYVRLMIKIGRTIKRQMHFLRRLPVTFNCNISNGKYYRENLHRKWLFEWNFSYKVSKEYLTIFDF